MLAACALYGAIGLWAFVRMYRKMVADRDQWRDTANNWRDELEAECNLLKVENAKLREAFNVLYDALEKRRGSGHEGDSDSGEHYGDCTFCEVDGALLHASALLAETEVDDG